MKELTPVQKHYVIRTELEFSTTVSMSATYSKNIFDSTNNTSRELLLKTLRALIYKHEALRIDFHLNKLENTQDQSEDWRIKHLDIIAFGDVIEYLDISELDSNPVQHAAANTTTTTTTVNEGFLRYVHSKYRTIKADQQKPLWRLYVVNDTTACFLYNHALADGMSGVIFHDEFQKTYNDIANKKLIIENDTNEDNGLTDDIAKQNLYLSDKFVISGLEQYPLTSEADVITKKPGTWFIMSTLFKHFVVPYFPTFVQKFINGPDTFKLTSLPEKKSSCAHLLINIPPEHLSNILKACKSKDISVSIWLLSALQFVLKDYFNNLPIHYCIPINLRRLIPVNEQEKYKLGLNIAGFFSNFNSIDPQANITDGQLISRAQVGTRELRKSLNNNFSDEVQMNGMLNYVPSVFDYTISEHSTPCETAFECSNLGFYKPSSRDSDDDLVIKDLVFGSGGVVGSSVVSLYLVSTPQGGANLQFVTVNSNKEYLSPIKEQFIGVVDTILE
uniref:Alcohol acetyltransferase ATF(B)5 n=1 Tax=Saccharomycopsis fibuligera TaxID=4944 RepID=A0A8F2J2L7_SACFI|nr:alcohol acetyltransferase ATF(B)5 [Saccharomycopsis fibuligera]